MVRIFFLAILFHGTFAAWSQVQVKQHGPYALIETLDAEYLNSGRVILSTGGGMYLADPGGPWRRIETYFNTAYFAGSFTKDENGIVYAWDKSNGVHYTQDNGDTWRDRFFYFTDITNGDQLQAVQLDGDTVFAATAGGLGYVPNGEFEGSAFSALLGKNVTHLQVHDNIIVAGTTENKLYVSLNRGSTWTISGVLTFSLTNATLELSGNKLFVGTNGSGVKYSNDLGQNWISKNGGLTNLTMGDLYIDQTFIYTVSDKVYRSALDGTAWQAIDSGIPGTFLETCVIANGTSLFLGGWGKVYTSANSGTTWAPIPEKAMTTSVTDYLIMDSDSTLWASGTNSGSFTKAKNSVDFAPHSAEVVGEALIENDKVYFPVNSNVTVKVYDRLTRLYLSSFSPSGVPLLPKKIVHASNGFFVSTQQAGVWKYTTSNTWQNFSTGLPSLKTYDFLLSDDVLYVATGQGLFHSGISSPAWVKFQIPSSDPAVSQFVVLDSLILTGSVAGEMYISTDYGNQWEAVDVPSVLISDIHYSDGVLYASAYAQLFTSFDLGKSWSTQDFALHPYTIFLNSLVATKDSLFLGTIASGILSTARNFSQVISFSALPDKVFGDASFNLTATASSGLPVAYSSSDPLVASVSGATVTIVGAGTVTITATQTGNSHFAPATPVNQTLLVNKATQVITFPSAPDKVFGDAPITLNATTTSGLPLQFSSTNALVAVVNGTLLTMVGAGSTTVLATQVGNANYKPAQVGWTLSVSKANQTITFPAPSSKTMGDPDFVLSGTSSSGLLVTFVSSDTLLAKVDGVTVTLRKAGSVTITARQAGNNNFRAAPDLSRSFCINPEKPVITASASDVEPPVLTSSALTGNQWYLNGSAIVGATSTTLTALASGVYTVTASAGFCVSHSSDEHAVVVTGTEPALAQETHLYPNPADSKLMIHSGDFDGHPIQVLIIDATGKLREVVFEKGDHLVMIDVSAYASGTYMVRTRQKDRVHTLRFVKK